jgi:hypothetical protein
MLLTVGNQSGSIDWLRTCGRDVGSTEDRVKGKEPAGREGCVMERSHGGDKPADVQHSCCNPCRAIYSREPPDSLKAGRVPDKSHSALHCEQYMSRPPTSSYLSSPASPKPIHAPFPPNFFRAQSKPDIPTFRLTPQTSNPPLSIRTLTWDTPKTKPSPQYPASIPPAERDRESNERLLLP